MNPVNLQPEIRLYGILSRLICHPVVDTTIIPVNQFCYFYQVKYGDSFWIANRYALLFFLNLFIALLISF